VVVNGGEVGAVRTALAPRARRRVAADEDRPAQLRAARTGEAWALQALFAWLGAPVRGYLRANGAEADDLASEVFVRAFRAVRTFEGDEADFRSWVFRIARNVLIDERRRAKRQPMTVALSPSSSDNLSGGDAEREAMASLGEAELRRVLSQLTNEQRDVLLLRVLGDMTVDQAAAVMGRRPGAIKALQLRALAAARRQLVDPSGLRREIARTSP
jgi:RNA polymerase sigma factor (sigma-70 family)